MMRRVRFTAHRQIDLERFKLAALEAGQRTGALTHPSAVRLDLLRKLY